MTGDQFDLDRFIRAQSDGVYEQALDELNAGRKANHWMWFIFPQHRDLGRSGTAKFYGLSGLEEATAYANHVLLGERLRMPEGLQPSPEQANDRINQLAGGLGQATAIAITTPLRIFTIGQQ